MRLDVNSLINSFVKGLAEESKKYPEAIGNLDRERCIEFFDYSTLPLTSEDLSNIEEILNTPSDDHGRDISQYVATNYELEVSQAINKFAQKLLKDTLKKYPFYRQVMFLKNIQTDSLAYNFVADTFSIDMDAKEIVRALMEYQNPYCLHQIKLEHKTNEGWKSLPEDNHTQVMNIDAFFLYTEALGKVSNTDYTHFFENSEEGELSKYILTNKSKTQRVVHSFECDLEKYIKDAIWFGSALTKDSELLVVLPKDDE